ncbi:MAG: hypothetical protein HRT69_15505 [Flavobacteriaceae bacterium]|nr:hypothetical protein [Flavobacteriaceae bacterium]
MTENESSKKNIYFILFIITLLLSAIIAFLVNRDFKYKKKLLELEKNALIRENEQITIAFNKLKNSSNDEERVKAKQEILKLKILTEDDWNFFKNKFELLFPNFLIALKNSNFKYTKSEERFLILKKLGIEAKEISDMIGVSKDSVLNTQHRIRKKMSISKDVDIIDYLSKTTDS